MNCVDCLDRTNIAQFVVGKHVLGLQVCFRHTDAKCSDKLSSTIPYKLFLCETALLFENLLYFFLCQSPMVNEHRIEHLKFEAEFFREQNSLTQR